MNYFKRFFSKKEKENPNLIPKEKETIIILKDFYKPRDTRKDKTYLQNRINYIYNAQEQSINTYEKEKEKFGEKYIGTSYLTIIRNNMYCYIFGCYSIGEPVNHKNDWSNFYKKSFKYFLQFLDKRTTIYETVKVVSVGILLNIEKEYFEQLSQKLQKEKVQDYIIDFLVHSQVPEHPVTNQLLYSDNRVERLKKSTEITKEDAIKTLKKYLEKDFYTIETLPVDYEAHTLSGPKAYNGYWSVEVAAIVKIIGLDDKTLKDNPYYPYDLVHWQN